MTAAVIPFSASLQDRETRRETRDSGGPRGRLLGEWVASRRCPELRAHRCRSGDFCRQTALPVGSGPLDSGAARCVNTKRPLTHHTPTREEG